MLAPACAETLHVVCVRVFCFVYGARGRTCAGRTRIVCGFFGYVHARTCFIQLTVSVGDVSGHEWLSNVDKQDWCNGASTPICVSVCLCAGGKRDEFIYRRPGAGDGLVCERVPKL